MIQHTGVASAIRDYVSKWPVSRLRLIAKHTGYSMAVVGREARRMALRGLLVKTGKRERVYYSLGRALVTHDPEVVKENDRRRCREYKKRRRARLAAERALLPKPVKPPKPKKEKPVKAQKPKPNNHAILRAEIAASIPKPAPVSHQRAETIEEFLQRGGKIEREPARFCPYTAYARFGGTTRMVAGFMGSNS